MSDNESNEKDTDDKDVDLLANLLQENKISDVKDENKNIIKNDDTYTESVLKEQFDLHKNYVNQRKESSKKLKITFRLPSIPEDISENIIKFIIHKNGDTTSNWNCSGDLISEKEGKQECKCFTSDGPPSFTPSSDWDVIYFLDARNWLNNKLILYKINLKRSSDEWKKIKVNKKQTFDDQCKQGRRPRLTWNSLQPQISEYTTKIFEGTFDDIFTPSTKE
jgi:hypothetical protein